VYKKHPTVEDKKKEERFMRVARNMYDVAKRRIFLAMRDQQRKEDLITATFSFFSFVSLCPTLTVVIYQYKKKTVRPRELDRTLPSKPIDRNNRINEVLGTKMYPETKVVFKYVNKRHDMKRILAPLKSSDKFRRCEYADELIDSVFTCSNVAIAYATHERIRNVVVGACSWSEKSGHRSLDIEIHYLCSSKMCRGAGTSIMYAMEDLAQTFHYDGIRLLADGRAKPFYFKMGLKQNETGGSGSTLHVINNTNNTAQSRAGTRKKRIVFPSRSERYMQKKVRTG
jgi:hypothetical protein